MDLVFTRQALKQLKALPAKSAKLILGAMRQVASLHPQRMPYVTELVGRPGVWRAKKGDYRALYQIAETEIIVIRVSDRKDAYDG